MHIMILKPRLTTVVIRPNLDPLNQYFSTCDSCNIILPHHNMNFHTTLWVANLFQIQIYITIIVSNNASLWGSQIFPWLKSVNRQSGQVNTFAKGAKKCFVFYPKTKCLFVAWELKRTTVSNCFDADRE